MGTEDAPPLPAKSPFGVQIDFIHGSLGHLLELFDSHALRRYVAK